MFFNFFLLTGGENKQAILFIHGRFLRPVRLVRAVLFNLRSILGTLWLSK
jgi:hypothetical protein